MIQKKKLDHVFIMAAGTGGHIFPGLAIARNLKSQGIRVSWLGTPNGMEVKWVSAENFPFYAVDISGLRGKRVLSWLKAPFKLFRAFLQSIRIFLKEKPDVVLAMGGFVCGPGGLAARCLSIPLVIHEQNSIAGLTNRLLSKASFSPLKILEAFPNSFSQKTQTVLTGNPVREDLLQVAPPEQRLLSREGTLKLLILGGSRGAQAINQTVPHAMALVPLDQRLEIYHQTGQIHLEETKQLYSKHQIEAKIVDFINDMPSAYQWADLVLCRSGALTLAELCCVGIGSILVPFPYAVDDHQTSNAKYLSQANAAILLRQQDLSAEELARQLMYFSKNRHCLMDMAKNAYSLRIEDATQKVVRSLQEMVM